MLLSCTQAHVCMLLFGVLSACNDAASPVLTDRFLACNISWDGALSSQRREASCWSCKPHVLVCTACWRSSESEGCFLHVSDTSLCGGLCSLSRL